MKATFFSLITMCLIPTVPMHSADHTNRSAPILVELFTSEGCSSCPPADRWLQQIDAAQPIAGAEIIVMSEHVDYWDHDGWKDPYSLGLCTDRQSGYVRAMGLNSAYTPQIVVDGNIEMHLSEPQQIRQSLMNAATDAQVPVTISTMNVAGGKPGVLRAHIEVNGEHERRNADIFAAVALDHAESQVARGENGGKRLTHVAVVEELFKIGKLEKGRTFINDLQVKLRPNMEAANLRLIVFVQEPEFGKVLGAALQKDSKVGR